MTPVTNTNLLVALSNYEALSKAEESKPAGSRSTYLIKMDQPNSDDSSFSVVKKVSMLKEGLAYSPDLVSLETLNGHIGRQLRVSQVSVIQAQIVTATPLGVDRVQFIKDAQLGLKRLGKTTGTSDFHTFARDTIKKAGRQAKKAPQIALQERTVTVKTKKRRTRTPVIQEPTNWDEIDRLQREREQTAAREVTVIEIPRRAFPSDEVIERSEKIGIRYKLRLPEAEQVSERRGSIIPERSDVALELSERVAGNPSLIKAFAEYERLSKAEEGKFFKKTYLIKIDETTGDTPTFSVVRKVSGIIERLSFLFGRASYSRADVLSTKVRNYITTHIGDRTAVRLFSAHISESTGQIETLEKTAFQGFSRFQKQANRSINRHYNNQVYDAVTSATRQGQEIRARRSTVSVDSSDGDEGIETQSVSSASEDRELRIAARRTAQRSIEAIAPGPETSAAINTLEQYDLLSTKQRTSSEPGTLSEAAVEIFEDLMYVRDSPYESGYDADSVASGSQSQISATKLIEELEKRTLGLSGIIVGVSPTALIAARSALLKLTHDLGLSSQAFKHTLSSLNRMNTLGMAGIQSKERKAEAARLAAEQADLAPAWGMFGAHISDLPPAKPDDILQSGIYGPLIVDEA